MLLSHSHEYRNLQFISKFLPFLMKITAMAALFSMMGDLEEPTTRTTRPIVTGSTVIGMFAMVLMQL